jgi:HEAT repeat protein
MVLWMIASFAFAMPYAAGEEPASPTAPSPPAAEAIRLLESEDPYHRQLGFLRLEALRELSTLDTIKRYLESGDPEMRAYSLRALAAIEGAPSVQRLIETLKTDKHPRVRRAALLGLEPLQQSDPRILPALMASLRDRNSGVRMTAVDIVSRIDHAMAREAILVRNKRERNRDVRRVLSLAMKRLGG